jgi:hypothetical protein
MDEETGRLLGEAGCDWIQLGIQSMDDDFKKESLLRYEKTEDIERALTVMHKNKINVRLDHMFGLPNEPVSAQENALNLYKTHHVARINTFWTCYLPGTQMMNEAIAEGRLSTQQAEDIYEGREFYFYRNTDNVKDKALQNMYLGYEFLFKIIPLLPRAIKSKIKLSHVMWIPSVVKIFIMFFADVVNGIVYGLPDLVPYINHYIFHLAALTAKIFGKKLKATTPKAAMSSERVQTIVLEPGDINSVAAAETTNAL